MTYELGPNRYGKSRVRVVKVGRGDRHEVRDLTVDVALEGDFSAAHVAGDNANVIATDTMKNTVYALAADRLTGSIETFGLAVAGHFAEYRQVSRSIVSIREHAWDRIRVDGRAASDAFVRSGSGTRTTTIAVGAAAVEVESGIEDLVVMKTRKSAFVGFERDRFTTLPEAEDRIMATRVTATWGYGPTATGDGFDFDGAHRRSVDRLLASFADHQSASVQASIWVMATAMLDAERSIDWVRMVLPNLHHWTVDLARFGVDDRSEVLVATTEPHGLIDATVRRADVSQP